MNTPRVSREQATNTITVTGCGDCPMYHDIEYYCSHPDHNNEQGYLFDNCQLPTDSITIKLKQDGSKVVTRKPYKISNKTGHKGIRIQELAPDNPYNAYISVYTKNGKQKTISLGYFPTLEEAVAFRNKTIQML